ncbi:hypothetical protein HOY82DRAFT_538855 [Tuber indicum]|nr:hypothetical protein HOY82DRAFT_538855 [Tuber indicum]
MTKRTPGLIENVERGESEKKSNSKADMTFMVWRFVTRDACLLQLFANVLKHHVVKLDYQQLARAMGDSSSFSLSPTLSTGALRVFTVFTDVTPKAISHRIAKIKEKAQAHRNRWDPYIRLVPSGKRVASLKPAPKGTINEEGDDEEGKRFVDLKSEDGQLFSTNSGGVDGGVVVGSQMLRFDESCGGEIGDAVVAAADCGGGGGGDDGRNYLLGVDGQGHWPVPASESVVYGMYEAAEGAVGKDGVGIHLPCAAMPSYPSAVVVDDDGGEDGSRAGRDFHEEGEAYEKSA